MPAFVPVVEGQGDVLAVPALLHRLAIREHPPEPVIVNPPIRIKAGSFLNNEDYFRKYIELAAAKAAQSKGSVLVMIDCEDDCPATLGPHILERARAVRGDVQYFICLAYREYETWFLTAISSLGSLHGIPEDIQPPPDPERIRGAKGWLSQKMRIPYDPVIHQLEFTKRIDLTLAAGNDSFRRLSNFIKICVLHDPP